MCTFFSVEPIRYTLAEAAALIIQKGFTKRKYEKQRKKGIARNFNVYPAYNRVKDFRKEFCGPSPDSMSITDNEVVASLQAVADWQLGKRLGLESVDLQAKRQELKLESREKVDLLDDMSRLVSEGYSLEHLIKYGTDGFSDNSEYKDVNDGAQSKILGSVGVSVLLRAVKNTENGILTEELWRNNMANSWFSVFPLRYCFESESVGTTCLLH